MSPDDACRRCGVSGASLCETCRDRQARRFEVLALLGIVVISLALVMAGWRPWGRP